MTNNKIQLILAIDKQGAIGTSSGEIPWKIPEDMAHFKEVTLGKIVVIGFKTYQSIRHLFPLGFPGRQTVVLTRSNAHKVPSEIGVIKSIDEISSLAIANPGKDIVIAGGADIYNQVLALDFIDEIILSCVHLDSGADIKLKPEYNLYYFNQFLSNQKQLNKIWKITYLGVVPGKQKPVMVFEKQTAKSVEAQFSQALKELESGLAPSSVKPVISYKEVPSAFSTDISFTIVKLVRSRAAEN